MVDLQELISRGRFIFSNAQKRKEVFNLVNGKRSTKEIATKAGRSLSAVIQDLEKLRDVELVREKRNGNNIVKKNGATVYEKIPLIKHVPPSYFDSISKTNKLVKEKVSRKGKTQRAISIRIPTENEILDICKNHEDQLYEFKAPRVEINKITREIAAFLHTKSGGIIFYGIDDDGGIISSDLKRYELDHKIQNSIRNTISPQPNIEVKEKNIMGSTVLLVVIPPWDRKTIYQYTKDGRYYIRRGENVFALKPDEITKLSKGEYVV